MKVAKSRKDSLKESRPHILLRVRYRLEYRLVKILAKFMNFIPNAALHAMSKSVATFLYYVMRRRREIALNNLKIAYGKIKTKRELNTIAKKSFQNVALSVVELFTIRKFTKLAPSRITFKGCEYLEKAFKKMNGVILVISHLGSWEYLGFLPFLRKYPCSVIAKPLKNPYLYSWVHELRESTGLININKKESVKRILRELKQNHLVAILIDQWAGDGGITSTFFGLKTSTTSIPARLAKRTGAALIPAYCLRKPGETYEIQIHPPVNMCGNQQNWEFRTTKELDRQLEAQIKLYPEQWTWGHRRWKAIK